MKHTGVYRFTGKEGYERVITAENSALRHLGFSRILLESDGRFEHEVCAEEIAIILQEGDFEASVVWEGQKVYDGVCGKRQSVFDERPYAIYLPPGSKIKLESRKGMEARVFTAPCQEGNPPYFCGPEDVKEGTPGALNWRRKYRFIFGPPGKNNDGVTKKLIIGESVSVPGGWIGFPAHKHDLKNAQEFPLEEIFSFKVKGPHGAYVIQHSYGLEERWDEFNVVDADDYAIALIDGYHTSMAVPGCTEYLLWGLAGEEKIYKLQYDERFAWLADAEALFTF